MRFLVNIELDIPEGDFLPEFNLSDAAPELIEHLLSESLKPQSIRWASIVKIPERAAGFVQ